VNREGRRKGFEGKKLTEGDGFHHLVEVGATGGGRARHNKFVAMSIVGLVVQIHSEDFNVARI